MHCVRERAAVRSAQTIISYIPQENADDEEEEGYVLEGMHVFPVKDI